MNEKEKNDLFIKACEKAGLKVMKNARSHVADGIVVRDDQGRKYTVDSNARLISNKDTYKVHPNQRRHELLKNADKTYNVRTRAFTPSTHCEGGGNSAHNSSAQKRLGLVGKQTVKKATRKRGTALIKG